MTDPVPYQGTAQNSTCSELSRGKGQIMSHHDRDAEIAAFILTKGVTRCPTACVLPTQGSPEPADQTALDELRRMKIATRQRPFTPWRSRDWVANSRHPRDF